MRQYRILEGLFFNKEDRALLRERIRTAPAGAGFTAALLRELAAEDAREYPPLQYDWYAYNPDIMHSTTVDNYQNFNGEVTPATAGLARRAYLRMLALELLDKTEYRDAIRADMLRFPREYPLHLFVMCDLGLILYTFLTFFLTVLDAERELFTEAEQFELDNFARGVTMDILWEQEEWLRCDIGQSQHCNNHMVAHSQAVMFAGLYYCREDWVKYGLENPEGILTYLEDGMTDPGIGAEGSLTYNLMSLVLLMESAEWLRRAGHPLDLYHKKNARGYDMKTYFEAAVNCVAPNGRVVPIGDNYARATYLYDMEVFFRACAAYGEELPCLQWLAQRSTTDTVSLFRLRMEPAAAEKPAVHSAWYKTFGTAILKTVEGPGFWDSDAKTLAVRTGHGYIHGNCDHMAMLLFAGGNYLIRDFEGKDNLSRHCFSAHITRTLNRSRLAHSAVMIDGGDTRHMKDKYLKTEWVRGDGWQRLTVEDAERHLYPGVWMKRTLTLYHDRLEDVYEVDCGDAVRDIDYLIHIGDSEYRPAFEPCPELLKKWFPAAYPRETLDWMRDITELDAPAGCITAACPGVNLSVRAEGAEKGLAFTLPEADDLSMAGSHSYLLRVHGSKARFEACCEF